MSIDLPPNAPRTSAEAFAYIGNLPDRVTIDDLKILALVEAIGKELYDDLASRTSDAAVAELLRANGREELVHAHRVSEAIEILTGTAFPIPPIGKNPIYTPLDPMPVTRESLIKLADAEFGGRDLYAGVAASFEAEAAKELFAKNGEEERGHGERLLRAADLLPAG